jgi:hypothetical protein
MKLRDNRFIGPRGLLLLNREMIRTRTIITESKLNNEKSHELRHTARNLQTISRLMREIIHSRRHRNLTNH